MSQVYTAYFVYLPKESYYYCHINSHFTVTLEGNLLHTYARIENGQICSVFIKRVQYSGFLDRNSRKTVRKLNVEESCKWNILCRKEFSAVFNC